MEVDIQKLKRDIVDRANVGATKSHAPELYHAIALLVALIDNDFTNVYVNPETGWYTMKPKPEWANTKPTSK